jgi:hypothetical protein
MTVAELKRRLTPGTLVRTIAFRSAGPVDHMRVVAKADTVQYYLAGETFPGLNTGPAFSPWPKAANLIGHADGFEILVTGKDDTIRYQWVDASMIGQTPQDMAVHYLLNSWEHTPDKRNAMAELGDLLRNPQVAGTIIDAWAKLGTPERIHAMRPEPCDARLRTWLSQIVDWTASPLQVK